ncbi:MAG: radical SAM protein [Muribaculaceae bacterium]|nr:radical SAM protein [Muribaculaceae bacterium]
MSDYIEKEISGDKFYSFPEILEEIKYNGKWIIISPLTANWIVLENDSQLSFFHLLYDFNLEDALSRFGDNKEDAEWVIIQLEARCFERKETHLKQNIEFVHLYLTNECNMRCPHCYMYAGPQLNNELRCDEILKTIDELASNGIKSIVFSGGEPLLNSYFKEFVQQAYKNKMEVEVLSNGTLWNEGLIKELAPFLSSVQISIDGFDENSNAIVRGKGNFLKALNTVDLLLKYGVKTSVAMVPKWSENLDKDKEHYISFIRKLRDKYKMQPFEFNIVGEVWNGRDLNLSLQDRIEFKSIVDQIFREVYGQDAEDTAFIEYHKGLGLEDNCAYGNLSIAANGEVYLCAQIQPLNSIGNIRTHTVKELLSKSKIAKELSEVSRIKPCSDCAIRYICGGDCRIKYFTYLNQGLIPKSNQIPERECTREYKESIYDLMIRTNEQIFQ